MSSISCINTSPPISEKPAEREKTFLQPSEIETIKNIVPRILFSEHRIPYNISRTNHIVFSNDKFDFKMLNFKKSKKPYDFSEQVEGQSVKEILDFFKKGKAVCEEHQLNLLHIPKFEMVQVMLTGRQWDLLVTEKLHLAGGCVELPEDTKKELARQLAIFILNTGSDVAAYNLSFVNFKKSDTQQFKVGLLDLRKMNSVYKGLFGGYKKKGLVDLFPLEKNTILSEVEKKLNIPLGNLSFERSSELNFAKFQKSKEKLKKIADELYKVIVFKKHCDSSFGIPKKINKLYVNINEDPFRNAHHLCHETKEKKKDFTITEEEECNETYLGIVVNEFIRLKLIKKVLCRNGHGWVLET